MIHPPPDIRPSIEALFPDKRIIRQGRNFRVGKNQALSVCDSGLWFDFSDCEGGDFPKLVRRETLADWPKTLDWLKSHGWHVDDGKPKPTRQTKPINPDDADFLADIVYGLRVLERNGLTTRLDVDAYELRRREYLEVTGTHWPYRLGDA